MRLRYTPNLTYFDTGSSSPGEQEMTRSTSEVAVCCSRASASSRVRALTCSCRSARVELTGRVAVGALLRLDFVVLVCRVFAGLRLMVRCRLTESFPGPTTIHYHIMRPVVHHSKIGCECPNARSGLLCLQ
jgi:hypothetical protein